MPELNLLAILAAAILLFVASSLSSGRMSTRDEHWSTQATGS